MIEVQKKCSRCKTYKTLNSFYRDKRSKDGVNHWCKQCRSEYRKTEASKKSTVKYIRSAKGMKTRQAYLTTAQGQLVRKQVSRRYCEEHKSEIKMRGRKYYGENREAIIKRCKRYNQTPIGRVTCKKAMVNHRKKYPERRRAHVKLQQAVRLGVLKKPNCCVVDSSDCSDRLEAHHEDYSKPLQVIWLCSVHHNWVHNQERS